MRNKPTTNNTNRKEQIVGALELFVVCSIGFMSFIVITGLEDVVSKLLTIPALVWAVMKLVTKFTR